jgi:hypothetical protein
VYQKTQWLLEPESKNVFLAAGVVELVDVDAPTTLTCASASDVMNTREISVQAISAHARARAPHRLDTAMQ